MKLGYLLLLSLPFLVASVPMPQQVSPEENEVQERSNTEDGNWKMMENILEECYKQDMTSCLGIKAVAALERASRMVNLDVVDGVSFVKTSEDSSGRSFASEADVQNTLAQDPSQRTSRLIDMFMEAVAKFLQTHSLQFRLPSSVPEQIQRALDEGRGKKKILKSLLPILLAVGAKLLLLIPAAIGLVGLIAAKALVVSKLALLIAGAIAIQKLLGGGGLGFGKNGLNSGSTGSGGWSSGGSGWNGGGGGGGSSGGWSSGSGSAGWSRSLDTPDAHQMAYKAQVPEQIKTVSQ